MERTLLKDGWSAFESNFLNENEADLLFEHCLKKLPWEQGNIKLFGREIAIPRLESFHGETDRTYSYSGKTLTVHPFDAALKELKDKISLACGYPFNCVLVNYYRNGNDSNGWHADNEKELGINPVIASLSLGATRRFDLKHLTTGERHDLFLNNGSLLIMGGALQHHWKHQIPKQKKISEPRINLTFRFID